VSAARAATARAIGRFCWPTEQLESHRTTALRALIAHVKTRSPWHAERLAGIDGSTVNECHLQSIPPMTKADLMKNFDAIVTDSRLTLSHCVAQLDAQANGAGPLYGRYTVSRSGGSSGTPATVVFDLDEMAANAGSALGLIERWNGRVKVLTRQAKAAVLTSLDPVLQAQQVGRALEGVLLSVDSPTDAIVETLNRARPDVLMTYPSLLPMLAHEARSGRLEISPSLVIGGAEPMLPEHRRATAETWRCALIDGWGSSEVGVAAVGSGFEGGMLLLDDRVIVEPVDEHGRPVTFGTLAAKVYVTPLLRYTLPLLRYELTDQIRFLAGPPCCGANFRRIWHCENRLEDSFTYTGDMVVPPQLFVDVLGRERCILEYQVRQTENGVAVALTTGGPIDLARVREDLFTRLRSVLKQPTVSVEKVARIPRTGPALKLRRFIPLPDEVTQRH